MNSKLLFGGYLVGIPVGIWMLQPMILAVDPSPSKWAIGSILAMLGIGLPFLIAGIIEQAKK